VLASGDPLFYGIGRFLAERFDGLRFEPAVGSMQLAFARLGLPWQDAVIASIHGRDLRSTLLPLLGKTMGLFSHDGGSPAAVARFLARYVDPATDYAAAVAEDLGGPAERLTRGPLVDFLDRRFGPLNVMVLLPRPELHGPAVRHFRAQVPGAADDRFLRPVEQAEVMTRQEVRAVVLAKLLGPTDPGDPVWDIGAGLGTVAIEVAVLRPEVEVLAVERDPARADFLRHNRDRFGALNVRVLEGEAPAALADEPETPRYVFLGGSGGRLTEILDLVRGRLRPGGRLLATFVTLENLALVSQRLRDWGWRTEVVEVHVARSDPLAGLTGLKPLRGVFVVSADKPGAAHA
jgi:precorrin-6Y C5,15-methyltransferase (decarboxylating)